MLVSSPPVYDLLWSGLWLIPLVDILSICTGRVVHLLFLSTLSTLSTLPTLSTLSLSILPVGLVMVGVISLMEVTITNVMVIMTMVHGNQCVLIPRVSSESFRTGNWIWIELKICLLRW